MEKTDYEEEFNTIKLEGRNKKKIIKLLKPYFTLVTAFLDKQFIHRNSINRELLNKSQRGLRYNR